MLDYWLVSDALWSLAAKRREAKTFIFFLPTKPLQAFLLYLKIANRAQVHIFPRLVDEV